MEQYNILHLTIWVDANNSPNSKFGINIYNKKFLFEVSKIISRIKNKV